MDKRFSQAVIIDYENTACACHEIEAILDVFEHIMKYIPNSINKAWYDIKNFYRAKENGIDKFNAMIERQIVLGQRQWTGIFECGDKKLTVLGTLENN